MRKLFFNPLTCLGAAVALFFTLRWSLGHPRSWYGALGVLALFAYGCGLIFLAHFRASAWFPVIKALKFPEAWRNPVFRAGVGCSSLLARIVAISAYVIFFGGDAAKVLRFSAALATVVVVAAVVPLMRDPRPQGSIHVRK